MVFSSALTLMTFVLVVMVACSNSWDQFFFTFIKSFQSLCLGVWAMVKVRFYVLYFLQSLTTLFLVRYCHVTSGVLVRLRISRSTGIPVSHRL